MIEGVEKVRGEPDAQSLLDLEILHRREVRVPGARPDDVGPGARVVNIASAGIEAADGTVGKQHVRYSDRAGVACLAGVRVGAAWTGKPRDALRRILGYQCGQIAALNVAGERRIKGADKPQPCTLPAEVQGRTLVAIH